MRTHSTDERDVDAGHEKATGQIMVSSPETMVGICWDKLSRMEKSLSIDISRVSSFRFTDLPCFSL